jgi:hypothetical protein
MAKASLEKTKSAPQTKAITTKAPARKTSAAVAPTVRPITSKAALKKAAMPEAKAVEKPEAEPKEKAKKIKLVRDSFTMPEAEYAVLGEVKKACLKAGVEVKKSELLRVGVSLIRQLEVAKLKEILAGLPALKAGRPKKTK